MNPDDILATSTKLEQVVDLIAQLSAGSFEARTLPSGSDDLDKVLDGLNLLADKLHRSLLPRDCLERVSELFPGAVAVLGADGTIEAVNSFCEQLLEQRTDALIGKPLASLIAEGEDGQSPGLAERLTRSAVRDARVMLNRGASGSIAATVSACPIVGATGKLRASFLLMRENAPLPQEPGKLASLWAVLNHLPDSVSVTDLMGTFLHVNSEFERVTGWTAAEIVGKQGVEVGLFTPEMTAKVHHDVVPLLVRDGVVKGTEVTCRCRDGALLPCLASWAVVRGPDGTPNAVVSVFKSIAALRKAEERAEHLTSVLKAIRNVNQLIVKERDRERLIASACELLIETRGYSRAWIALLRDPMLFVQASGTGRATTVKQGLPPCAHRALSTPGVLEVHEPITHCAACPAVNSYHLDDAMVMRLEHEGKVFGVLGVACAREYVGDPEDRSLFLEVASDLGYALHGLEVEDERREAVGALRDSNELYRTLFEASPEGLVVVDAETNELRYSNAAFHRLFGYAREELRGAQAAILLEAAQREALAAQIAAVSQSSTPFMANVPCQRKDGSVFLADVRCARMKLGGKDAVLAFITDASERQRAERALSEAQERLAFLFEFAPDPYYIHDTAGTVVDFNRAAEELSGYSRQEAIGQNLFELGVLSQQENRQAIEETVAAQPGQRTPPREYLLHRKDGSQVPVETLDHWVKLHEQNLCFGIARDITERKRIERELVRANEELRGAMAQLIHRERLSALGELAANITHELNQPLNGIKLIAQSMLRYLEGYSKKQIEQDLTDVVKLVGTMSEIINHMRVFARLTDGGAKRYVDLNEAVEGALKLVAQQLVILGIELVVELGNDMPKVFGDRVRLEQVVLNLVTNARNVLEETPGDRPKRIALRTWAREKRKDGHPCAEVVLEVQDNGPGIAESQREKMFAPFFTTRSSGTGLGLSIVKRIVEEHDGRIELESTPGEGATFRILLESNLGA